MSDLNLADAAWRMRCDFCGWPLGSRDKGCAGPDDCSQRPRPFNDLTRWKQEIRKLEFELSALRADAEALRALTAWLDADIGHRIVLELDKPTGHDAWMPSAVVETRTMKQTHVFDGSWSAAVRAALSKASEVSK